MRIDLKDGFTVCFPFPKIFPEQEEFINHTYASLKLKLSKTPADRKSMSMIEMPTGSGKTMAILSVMLAFKQHNPSKVGKLIFATRTIPQVEHTLRETQTLLDFRKAHPEQCGCSPEQTEPDPGFLALAVTSRRRLCIHKDLATAEESADLFCATRTASSTSTSTSTSADIEDLPKCPHFQRMITEGPQTYGPGAVGVAGGKARCVQEADGGPPHCPFFRSRRSIPEASLLVLSYNYLLSPRLTGIVGPALSPSDIVVFDEAHNLENATRECYSMHLTPPALRLAQQSLRTLRNGAQSMNQQQQDDFREKYIELSRSALHRSGHEITNSEQLQQAASVLFTRAASFDARNLINRFPGSVRSASAFISILSRLCSYLVDLLNSLAEDSRSRFYLPGLLLNTLRDEFLVDRDALLVGPERLHQLGHVLGVSPRILMPLAGIAQFGQLMATYGEPKDDEGESSFWIILERPLTMPEGSSDKRIFEGGRPVIRLVCLDCQEAFGPIASFFDSVILMSGTLSPAATYAKLLGIQGRHLKHLTISPPVGPASFLPLIVSRNTDQTPLTSRWQLRSSPATVQNFRKLIFSMSEVCPDGIVVFFPSYRFMEDLVALWYESNTLEALSKIKLLFFETPDPTETAQALTAFRKACDLGRGAIFFAVARGKVAEGIDFKQHHGRACLVVGTPFMYSGAPYAQLLLTHLGMAHGIQPTQYLQFDAARATAQCLGRVIRGRRDYAVMVLADQRFAEKETAGLRDMMPSWILSQLNPTGKTVDEAVKSTHDFLMRQTRLRFRFIDK